MAYEDKWTDGRPKMCSMCLTTRDISGQYYYRRWKIRNAGLHGKVNRYQGNHIIPVVYNGKLYLFWPDFKGTAGGQVISSSSTFR
jgi:hypothetical protein